MSAYLRLNLRNIFRRKTLRPKRIQTLQKLCIEKTAKISPSVRQDKRRVCETFVNTMQRKEATR